MKWAEVRFEDVCRPTSQRDPTQNPGSLFRYIDIASVDKDEKRIISVQSLHGAEAPSRARKEIRTGDVLVSTVRPNLNTVALVTEDLDGEIASTGFCVLRANRKLADPRWVFYRCRTPEFVARLVSQMRGANYPAVSDGVVKTSPLPLPTLTEQCRILELLDRADALRRHRIQTEVRAARIVPAIFRKMFGDVRKNPKGLPRKRLGSLIRVQSGELLAAKSLHPTDGYPVYGGNGINGYYSRFMFDQPVIIIGRVGVYCGSVHFSREKCWVTDNALFVSEMDPDLNAEYLAAALRVANLNQYAGRAGQPLISGSRIYPIEILVPAGDEQERFASIVQRADSVVRRQQGTSENLSTLFDAMLRCAFTGELTSRWRKAHVEELATEMEQQIRYLNGPRENHD